MRSSRIEPDSRTMTMASMTLVGVLAVASFTLSFQGLIQAADWAGIAPQLRWLVPIVVDSTILVYAVAAFVQGARGGSTLLSWCAVGFFTAVSVAANAAHVLAPGGFPRQSPAPSSSGPSWQPICRSACSSPRRRLSSWPSLPRSARRPSAGSAPWPGWSRNTVDQRTWTSLARFPDHSRGSADHILDQWVDRSVDHLWTTRVDHRGPRPK